MKQNGVAVSNRSKDEYSSNSSIAVQMISTSMSSTSIVQEPSRAYYYVKRTLDIVLSLIGIILLLPLFLIIALCIKLDDGGAILHFREIIGRHGQRFYALKFRTMIPNA